MFPLPALMQIKYGLVLRKFVEILNSLAILRSILLICKHFLSTTLFDECKTLLLKICCSDSEML